MVMKLKALDFVRKYKNLISKIELLIQPRYMKYTNELRKSIKPWTLIKSSTIFNSEMEALGFLYNVVLKMYDEDIENYNFDEDETLLRVDDWFIQSMKLEYGKPKIDIEDSPLIWVDDLEKVVKRKDINFSIEVFYDENTKVVNETVVSGYEKKSKKFIGAINEIFWGEGIDDLIHQISESAKVLVKDI